MDLNEFKSTIANNPSAFAKLYNLCNQILTKTSQSILGNYYYILLSQKFLLSLHIPQGQELEKELSILQETFPESKKVLKLAARKKDTSSEAFSKLKDKDEASFNRLKISSLLSNNNEKESIKKLTDHLQVYQSDENSWKLLGKIFIRKGDFKSSSFCFEEVVLLKPGWGNMILLAESRLSELKNVQGLRQARGLLSQVLRVNGNDIRGLFSMLIATRDISGLKDKEKGDLTKLNKELSGFAEKKLRKVLSETSCNPKMRELALKVLENIKN
eukprot:snap_masked-scaffold_2-processed-gene-1.27-mRNA-1 protein AED:1.00 eAED:1.00 QI:0/-1/0/0/-1/1/1/0/271